MTTTTNQAAKPYNADTSVIRTMVRSTYDLQDLRVQMGNRITANFKAKAGLGQDSTLSEEDKAKEEKKMLDRLKLEYSRITDGVVAEYDGEEGEAQVTNGKLPSEKKFKGQELITAYSELLLVNNYITTLANEQRHFRDMEKILKKIPIYTEFLEDVRGIGPALAGIIVSEIDIHKAQYPSSLWKLAGLDVVHIGKYTNDKGEEKIVPGWMIDAFYAEERNFDAPYLAEGQYPVYFDAVGRSRKEFCLVRRQYINKEGNPAERNSITFNPFLKTKLIGVAGTSFLRAGIAMVDGVKMGVNKRLELAKKEGFDPKEFAEIPEDQAVQVFLKAKGHKVVVEPSPYAVEYANYKNRLNNDARHNEKTAGHKHNMAIRYMVKRFLVDLYNNWRVLEGLPVDAEYAVGVLGKTHGVAHQGEWRQPQHPRNGHPRYRQQREQPGGV